MSNTSSTPQSLAPSARRVTSASEARGLVAEALAALETLDQTLAIETSLMRGGRIGEALALTDLKQQRAGAYMRLLESVKANAIALARFSPDGVESLKSRHADFGRALHLNQTVIATVKSVSESLVRGLQTELSAGKALSVYGPGAAATTLAPKSEPIALSVRL
ncbi:MAG: hypothetical protein ABWZ80_06200 [Beijerinckiaceae bacterium]